MIAIVARLLEERGNSLCLASGLLVLVALGPCPILRTSGDIPVVKTQLVTAQYVCCCERPWKLGDCVLSTTVRC